VSKGGVGGLRNPRQLQNELCGRARDPSSKPYDRGSTLKIKKGQSSRNSRYVPFGGAPSPAKVTLCPYLSQQAQTVRRIFRPFVSAFRVVPTAQRLWVSSYSISVSLSYVDDSIGLILSYFTPEARISQQVSMFLVLTGTLARPRPCRHATAPLAWLSVL
jgi:hypothetical protein